MNKLALRKLFCVALFCAINFSVSLASTQVIEKFEKAPFIDGIVSMEEWGLPHMELKNYNMFTFPNGANKVELDGYSYFGYDNKHIYMAIAAKYDEHNNN